MKERKDLVSMGVLVKCGVMVYYEGISELIQSHDWKNLFRKIFANNCYEIFTQKYRDACEKFIPVIDGRHP